MDSDHVIIDPQNRVSRKHAEVKRLSPGSFAIRDVGSKNGTFVNGKAITPQRWVNVGLKDRITLSDDFVFNIREVFPDENPDSADATAILNGKGNRGREVEDGTELFVYRGKGKTVAFDPDKTSLGDMLNLDETPFKTIGREPTNDLVLNRSTISRNHCRIRMVAPVLIEIEDLGSTNGTFCDGVRLEPNRRYTYDSSVVVRLGKECTLGLEKIFPGLQVLPKKKAPPGPAQHAPPASNPAPNAPLTPAELKAFNELEPIWKEYQARQTQMANAMNNYMMGGVAVGGILTIALAPLGGIGALAGIGVTVISRYLGSQKSNELRNDFTYEEAFLQVYACPRCGESFQKKPWITIRDCFKCKVKFR
jgi:pSer/pThr/pTyr-binding forkhead associated (FHA) protein